jgi:hypothetical protein
MFLTANVYCLKQFPDRSRSIAMKIHYTEDATIQAVHTLFAKLAYLRGLTASDIGGLEGQWEYKRTVEETYAVIVFLEKAFDHLATELEYQQERLEQEASEVQGLW